MPPLAIIILAAGKGTRMKSNLAKVLHPLAGFPMLGLVLNVARRLQPEKLLVVIGFQKELIREKFTTPDINFVDQDEQLGTGHAVLMATPKLKGFRGPILILSGDVPLLKEETLRKLIKFHGENQHILSVLTTRLENPQGYGRILRNKEGQIQRIIEEKDLLPGEESGGEVNTGIYCVEAEFLFAALPSLSDQNAQKEYYLTDIVEKAVKQNKKVGAFLVAESSEVMGINTRQDLARASQILRERIGEQHMLAGVTLIDPQNTYIDYEVQIGRDTVIYPNCYLMGKTFLGENCVVEPGCKIIDTKIGNFVTIKASSVISESILEDRVEVGPFAHLRPQTVLKEEARIGNFVEVKKSTIGKGTKANHLSYLGDATLGERVNVGAGTITCNYDGKRKNPTYIEDEVFIGSNTALVAPIRIGQKALIGAGSTITKEVPAETMAVARAKQVHYPRKKK
ncbi:MAG: bifunctional UDP-N-acetylglucosamine diphosphorylase/glucosamine-1-phosphate N-acetyltransferase GlmU [Thermodesulfobacteriota bacterium]